MVYVPNADDSTNPTDAIIAETAQAEFRALKVKINTMVGLSTSGQSLPALYTIVAANLVTALAASTAVAATVTALTAVVNTKAPVFSPVFSGNPTGPTPAAGDSTASLATTAFVTAAIAAAVLAPLPTSRYVNSAQTLVQNTLHLVDTSSASFTVLLPSSPTQPGLIALMDPNFSWGAHPLTVDGNGHNLGVSGGISTFTTMTFNVPDLLLYVWWNTAGNYWEFS